MRKTGECWDGYLLLNAKVGPWDLKRGVGTNVDSRPMQPPRPQPVPTVSADALKEKKKRIVDEDAAAVVKHVKNIQIQMRVTRILGQAGHPRQTR